MPDYDLWLMRGDGGPHDDRPDPPDEPDPDPGPNRCPLCGGYKLGAYPVCYDCSRSYPEGYDPLARHDDC